ncbi:hypothetical protein YTPLAS21_19310 [Candidatus Nitrosocosmicus sp.]|nr:hypothetical protein YTPLAS21_19310 [Candidatus Nitrosocosmicus sp.]
MSIVKATNYLKHNKVRFTTIVSNTIDIIKHTGALGVYTYLASKPEDWIICKKHLQNHFECGRGHIDTCFDKLKEYGVLDIMPIKDIHGRVIKWETTLHSVPNSQEPAQTLIWQNSQMEIAEPENEQGGSGDSRIQLFQNVDFPECGKMTPTNKRYLNNKILKQKKRETAKSPSVSSSEVNEKDLSKQVDEVLDYYVERQVTNKRLFKRTDKRRAVVRKALKLYTVEECKQAIDGNLKNPWNQTGDPSRKKIELILRDSEKIEQYIGYLDVDFDKPNQPTQKTQNQAYYDPGMH